MFNVGFLSRSPLPASLASRRRSCLRRKTSLLACLLAVLVIGPALAQPPQRPEADPGDTIGEVQREDPALDALIPADAVIEVLANGYQWAEGPVWVPRDGGFVLFSEVRANRVIRWSEADGASVFMEPSGYTGVADYRPEPGSNGLAVDSDGNLLFCEHGDRRVSVMTWDGGKRTLADNYQGKRFNSPNDLVVHSNGDIYFTDPPYGLPRPARGRGRRGRGRRGRGFGADPQPAQAAQPQPPNLRELDFDGVYRLAKDGTLTLITGEISRPNGIGLSPDEKTLYVGNSGGTAVWTAFPVAEDGSAGEGEVFFDASSLGRRGGADGMAIDAQGNLFATGPGGVLIISPEGKLLGTIVTGVPTANCCFGGEDGSTLFITANSYLCRMQTTTKGIAWKE